MTTWAVLTSNVLRSLDDTGAVFHTTVRDYLEEAQLLLALARSTSEKTVTFPLQGGPLYPLHATLPDYLTMLRMSMGGKVLLQDHLATISLLDPEWMQSVGEPISWFLVGGTHFGLYPPAPEDSLVTMTYLADPSTTATSPVTQPQWHQLLESYARAIAIAKEAQYARAVELLKNITDIAGIKDTRFSATDRLSKEPAITDAVSPRPED